MENKKYELLVILNPDIPEEDGVSIVENMIEDVKSTVHEKDVWGLRTLAFDIKKHNRGRYVLFVLSFTDSAALEELKRELNMHDNVLRYSLLIQ